MSGQRGDLGLVVNVPDDNVAVGTAREAQLAVVRDSEGVTGLRLAVEFGPD